MKEKHNFVWKDMGEEDYLITCQETGGEFSTRLWKDEKFPNGYCPCCKKQIQEEVN